ncbi:hypothetical protein [Bosea sp. 685]|uniref:hypothetical protein n=1 Tax=Bosea sp. 685 TaxID=3080057 RepID=UPI002892EE44|nr:hypothetical protein [Bosea sp. 685]WNJ88713.1 hypothetical protein RMR04_20145 [Bosea sp. 685]
MLNSYVVKICRASLFAVLSSVCFGKALACQVPAPHSPFIVKIEPQLDNFDVVLEVVVDRIDDLISLDSGLPDRDFAQVNFRIMRAVKGQILIDRIESIIFRTMCAPLPEIGEVGFVAGKLTNSHGKILLNIATVR